MSILQDMIGEWEIKTFPDQTIEGMKNHLKREIIEYFNAKDFANEIEESCDIVILLLGIAHRQNYDLLAQIREKFECDLMHRKWGVPDAEGVISHIKDKI